MDYLFVYGTLCRALRHPMHAVLTRYADYAGRAVCRGRLYDLGSYPGLVLSTRPQDRVVGEVYAFHPPTRDRALDLLDRYEGCTASERPEAQEYRRERRGVVLEDGRRIEAWMYLYNHDPLQGLWIPSGDYVAYRRSASPRRRER